MYAAYGKTARRPARDFGLPLVAAAVAPGRALKSGHRRIFSSSYRYETPELEDRLVDGSEELSAALTVLKPLMVRVVELYDTPLEWYARWIVWIEKRNESRRTGTWSPHLGDLEDVLDFVRSELERLEVADGTLRELVRYEALKLEARWLPAPAEAVPAADARAASRLDPDTVLVRSCPYLLERFRHDLRSVIAGERSMPGDRDRWILVAKISLPELTTMEVSDLARRLLEHSETPRSIAELRSLVGANGDARDGALVATATQLVEHGLLQVVAA